MGDDDFEIDDVDINPKRIEELEEISNILSDCFKDDPKKITWWWFSKNPFFGYISPARVYMVRPEKVYKLIKNLREGNF